MLKNDFVNTVTDRLSLPAEALTAVPLIQLRGKTNLCVENHGGILQYTDSLVKIAVKGGVVTLRGDEISICRMTKRCLEIHGKFMGLELE